MAKSDIVSTVTTRIAAATSATPADELAILKVLGTKLGLNTDNVTNQASTASNTASSINLTDLTLLNQALDDYLGTRTTNITLPFSVERGDIVYANEFGSVFKNNFHDIQLTSTVAGFGVNQSGNAGAFQPNRSNIEFLDNTLSRTGLTTSQAFSLVASNGDILVLCVEPAGYFLQGYAVSTDMRRNYPYNPNILQLLTPSANIPNALSNIMITPNGTNSWNIYYRVNDGSTWNAVCRRHFSYNPTTKVFSAGSWTGGAADVLVNQPGLWVSIAARSTDNAFFVVSYDNGTNYIHEIVNSFARTKTILTNANINTSTNSYRRCFINKDGSNYYVVAVGSVDTRIVRADNTAVTVPAAAIPILRDYNVFTQINDNEFFCSNNQNTRLLRILKFSSNMTAVAVTTVGVDDSNGSPINATAYLRKNNTYYFYEGANNVISFDWNGTTVTVKPNITNVLPKYVSRLNGLIDTNERIITGYMGQMPSTSSFFTFFITMTQSVLLSNKCLPLFRVNGNAAANVSVNATLMNNLLPEGNDINYPYAYGYTKVEGLAETVKFSIDTVIAIAVSSSNFSVNYSDSGVNRIQLSDQVVLLTKPGKYICIQNGTSTPLCYIHPNNSGRLEGTSSQFFSFSSTVPFIVYGRGSVQYVGEL